MRTLVLAFSVALPLLGCGPDRGDTFDDVGDSTDAGAEASSRMDVPHTDTGFHPMDVPRADTPFATDTPTAHDSPTGTDAPTSSDVPFSHDVGSGGACLPSCTSDIDCQGSCPPAPASYLNCCFLSGGSGTCIQYMGTSCPGPVMGTDAGSGTCTAFATMCSTNTDCAGCGSCCFGAGGGGGGVCFDPTVFGGMCPGG